RSDVHRVKTVPRVLRDDSNHAGAKLEGLGWPVVAYDLERPGALENVDQLVLGMGLPMARAGSRRRTEKEEAVAVGTQSRHAALALVGGRWHCLLTEQRNLRRLCVDIDDGRHAVLHPLRLDTQCRI